MIMEIKITKITDSRTIIEFGKQHGLDDIDSWVNLEKLQRFLDLNFHVAFGAFTSPNSDLVGIIVGGLEEEGRLWIEALAVHSQWRKRGIGRSLIDKLASFALKAGFRAMFVDVDDDNYQGLEFYRKSGFIDAGLIKKYYHDNTNAIILLKELTP